MNLLLTSLFSLEIINYVDRIIYIDGQTTITGTHDELLTKNESYRKLIEINENIYEHIN